MNKFGIQYSGVSLEELSKEGKYIANTDNQYNEVRDIIRKFQNGYIERNLDKVDSFIEELFIKNDDISVLGTATGEIILGFDEVKQLIKSDWEGWGDLTIDCDNAHISMDGDIAWFSTNGSVKYAFEHTPERYDRYVDFIKSNAEDNDLTPKQKITFINWILTLNYHQREGNKREYLWPMGLSGVLLREKGKWKFTHLQFSIATANFPDERFESSKEYIDNYNEQRNTLEKYNKNNNRMTEEIEGFLKKFQTEFLGNEDISDDLVSKYFDIERMPYVIDPQNKWYDGSNQIKELFINGDMDNLLLDIDNAIVNKKDNATWVTVVGVLKQDFTEDELIKRSLEEIDNVFKSNLSSEEKLFVANRSIAYSLKETAVGVNYTCPIRMTGMILNDSNGPRFNYIHFSFPFYWFFEGKLDAVLIK